MPPREPSLFWCGEDKIIYGGETPIWHPRWALEALWNFEIPEDLQQGYALPGAHEAGEEEDPRREPGPVAGHRHRGEEAEAGNGPVREGAEATRRRSRLTGGGKEGTAVPPWLTLGDRL
jgi:hypothetical protein